MRWLNETLTGLLLGLRALVTKELQSRTRGWRPMWLLTVYLLLIAFAVTGALAAIGRSSNIPPNIGLSLFGTLAAVGVVLLAFITPALTAGAVSGERERQTLDLLLVTRGSPFGLIAGKLLAAELYVLYLLLAASPAFAVVYLFGGIPPRYLLVVLAVAVATALTFTSLGLLLSTLTRRTLLATVLTYLLALLLALGFPLIWGVSGQAFQALDLGRLQSVTASTPRVVLAPLAWIYLSPSITLFTVLRALTSSSGTFGGADIASALSLSQAVYVIGFELPSTAGQPTTKIAVAWAP
jgi:ABC-type transport system involved in multi-copper enzyme maturation permease subunit